MLWEYGIAPTDRTPATVVSSSSCSLLCSIRLDAAAHTTSRLEYFVDEAERDRSFNVNTKRSTENARSEYDAPILNIYILNYEPECV